jgi:predicted cobalt transporter CbtA
MVGKLLVRGMLAGVAAGLITFAFARVVGEPQVDQAISFEEKADAAKEAAQGHQHEHEEELVSRPTQAGLGLATGVIAYGAAIGGLFALTFAYLNGRVGRIGVRALSAWLALGAFVAIAIVPALKYPPNPPAVGDPDTIGYRTGLYFLMIAISVTALVFSMKVRRHVAMRLGTWNGSIVAGVLFIAIIAAVQMGLPVINEVPATFPAVVLWKFRVAALGMQALLWSVIGLLFGALAERVQRLQRGAHPAGRFAG